MKKYWDQHSQAGSIEEMMLDDDASKIEVQDREEILSLQPALKGKRVLELAAGIGRFTPYLAERVGPEGCVVHERAAQHGTAYLGARAPRKHLIFFLI